MKQEDYHKPTASMNVETMRRRLMEHLVPPTDLLQAAFDNLREQLSAKETKFFTHKGHVVSTREVVNYEARQRAQDQILSISGVYARERDQKPATPSVALEVDHATGVVRLIVGGSPNGTNGTLEPQRELPATASHESVALGDTPPDGAVAGSVPEDVKRIRVPRGKTPPEILRMLYEEE